MSLNNTYREVKKGKKAVRRDYSKVSGSLELPNLVEIQTKSFDWFLNEGIEEVFDEIFPIKNYNETISLQFLNYYFDEPKWVKDEFKNKMKDPNDDPALYAIQRRAWHIDQCRQREKNYVGQLWAKIKLQYLNEETGEVTTNVDDVFLGDFPILTPTGTFIINGAERVIVSQIVRSPGAYFSMEREEKTGKIIYNSELIPGRGTWLEFMTDPKKDGNINMSVDRKRKILSTMLFKTVGLALNPEKGEDPFNTTDIKKFMNALNLDVYDVEVSDEENREFLNDYILLYTGIFGDYEDIVTTLVNDKANKTATESLYHMYENQRSEERTTEEGAIGLVNAKFFDARRYDLVKAGRYKTNKKLGAYARCKGKYLAEDLKDENGKVVVKAGATIDKFVLEEIKETLNKGLYMHALPAKYDFCHPNRERDMASADDEYPVKSGVRVPVSYGKGLIGRIVAEDLYSEAGKLLFEEGVVLTSKDVKALEKANVETLRVYDGVMGEEVKLTAENVIPVLNYGGRLYSYGRLVDKHSDDVMADGELVVSRYIADTEQPILDNAARQTIIDAVKDGAEYSLYLVGAAVQIIYVKNNPADKESVKVIGTDPLALKKTILISDMYAQYSYLLNMMDGVGSDDDIDQLGNRRVRTVGELIQNQFRIGLSRLEKNIKDKMSTTDTDKVTPKSLINNRSLTMAIKEFFSSSQLSQFMDQQNPLAELTNKRRISALGPGGLTRERAGFEVRDVHATHYGRICPVETPEGPNIGLINYMTTYGKVNEYGFIETPYRKVIKENDYEVSDEVVYLAADDEMEYVIAQANAIKDGHIRDGQCVCRYQTETIMMPRESVELVDVSPKQIISIAAACIPFLGNDDATRALMGANMQRQAVPLLKPHSPYVGTGMEYRVAKDSGSAVVSDCEGVVTYVDGNKVIVTDYDQKEHRYDLRKFARSNAGTCINQRPIVSVGERIELNDILADGPSMENGELALGQNVKIAFMTWNGYNYEDAVIMSERLVKDDVYTSIHIEEYSIECRDTKLGHEEITRDIPNVSEASIRNLDSRGIVYVGSEVKEGDILVGKTTPKGQSELSPEEKLLLAIFGERSREVRDNSLKVPHGGAGIVQSIKILTTEKHEDITDRGFKSDEDITIKIYIVQKRKIHEGDKMSGRHGNKGVISRILPEEDMPFMADGTRIDIMLNPFGVPSRMNIGQVLEVHLGLAAEKLGVKFATSAFDGINDEELREILSSADATDDRKFVLYDGRSGEPFDERVAVGIMYMIKLAHMVDDKLHARATGPYSLVTQQPLGGKAQNGGQRFGEMEVWALEAYGASHTLSEILTVKSDDITGRTKTYEAIIKGKPIPNPSVGESFRVMTHELQALALDVRVFDDNDKEIDLSQQHEEDAKSASNEETVYQRTEGDGFSEYYDENDAPIEPVEAAFVGTDDYYDDDYND